MGVPPACLPLLLGSHQLIETFVWWGQRGRVAEAAGQVAMWAYLLIAFCVLPVLVPAGVMGIEPSADRRRWMAAMVGLGAVVSAVLLIQMIRGPWWSKNVPTTCTTSPTSPTGARSSPFI